MLRSRLVAASILLGVATPAHAQWRVGLEVASASYFGAARLIPTLPGGEEIDIKPQQSRLIALRVARTFGRTGVELATTTADLDFEGKGSLEGASFTSLFSVVEFSLLGTYELVRTGAGAALLAGAGVVASSWSPDDTDRRTRLGGIGVLGVRTPLAGRLELHARTSLDVSRSPFVEGELGVEPGATFERRPLRRHQVTLGLTYRF